MRKIMVCNVTTFSYNRGPSGGALYLGNIGSLKDRCVSDTCDEKIPVDFFGFSIKTPVSPLEPLGGMLWEWFTKTTGQNIQKRTIPAHPKIFNMHQGPGTRYGWSGVRYSGSGAYGIISFRVVV